MKMDFRTLEAYVEKGEGLQLEFKVKLPEPEKLMREAVALANTHGGLLLIGVDDDGEILGIKDAFETEEVFRKSAADLVSPPLEFTLDPIPLTRKRAVIAINLPPSQRKPHIVRVQGKGKKGIAYIRVGDKSMRASREMYFILLRGEDKDVKFEFGDKERILLRYLEKHTSITVKMFAKIAQIKTWQASKTLVLLVRANVLRIKPQELEDLFFLGRGF